VTLTKGCFEVYTKEDVEELMDSHLIEAAMLADKYGAV